VKLRGLPGRVSFPARVPDPLPGPRVSRGRGTRTRAPGWHRPYVSRRTRLPANLQDRDGARQLLASFFGQCQPMRRRVKHIWADGGYAGTLVEWTLKLWRCTLEIVKRNELHTFKVLPRRWVVERTFGWLGRYRRLNRDYERQAKTGETMVYLAMIRLMLARLGRL
jgi:transposase